ncbi:MAG: PAS domain S-box protein, partial [Chloroflexota bacterium]|nr:PAS domain S-box protein [Chloroflexota bacterium]
MQVFDPAPLPTATPPEGFGIYELLFDDAGRVVDARICEVNDEYEHLTNRFDARGKRLSEVEPDLSQEWLDVLAGVVADGVPRRLERYQPQTDRWFVVYIAPYPAQGPHGVSLLFTDITARIKASDALRRSEDDYRSLFNRMSEGFASCEVVRDGSGAVVSSRVVLANPAWERLATVFAGSGIGLPGTTSWWNDVLEQVISTQEPVRLERHDPAHDRSFEFSIFAREGDRCGVICNDVTHRLRRDLDARLRERRQSFLLGLSDSLRLHDDVAAASADATARLQEFLELRDVTWTVFDPPLLREADAATIAETFPAPVDRLGDRETHLKFSQTMVMVSSQEGDPPGPERQTDDDAVGTRRHVAIPLLKSLRYVAALSLEAATPRTWNAADLNLALEVAERIWAATERIETESTLRNREDQLRRMVNIDGVGVVVFDNDGVIHEANDYFLRLTGYDQERISSASLTKLMITPTEYLEVTSLQLERVLREGRVGPYEKEILTAGGNRIWMLFAGALLDDGRVVEFCLDITSQKAAESALRRSEERFRTLIQNLPDYAIFLLDRNGHVSEWTEGAERVKGYSSDDVLGRHFEMFFTEEDKLAGAPAEELEIAARTGRVERESWRVHKSGRLFWANEIVTAVFDELGQLSGFTKICRDLTERRAAEEAIRASSENLQARVEQATTELRALSRRLIRVQEEERRHISRELHDEIGQVLTGLMFQLSAVA